MKVTINYNGQAVAVEVTLEVYEFLDRAMQKEENVIRIGTSPMTPVQSMVDLWPKFQEYCPDIKFQMIPFENTPENAREILKNLGKILM